MVEPLTLSRTEAGRHADGKPLRKGLNGTSGHPHQKIAGTQRGKRRNTENPSHNGGIRQCIDLLADIAQHQRKRKANNVLQGTSVGHDPGLLRTASHPLFRAQPLSPPMPTGRF